MKKLYLFLSIAVLFSVQRSFSQVTTNGAGGLSLNYITLAAAVTDLNLLGPVPAPVVITLQNNETAPLGGYVITATGSAVNTIEIDGNGFTVTAFSPQTAGSRSDALIKIQGGDYITIKNFILQENASNTVTALATNTMTEYGIGLFLSSTTDGAQNNTIQNNTIALSSAYQNAFGIFSTSASSSSNANLLASANTGTNSNNKYYSNTISNVAYGITLISPPATATVSETGNDIGGASLATGNTITFGNVTVADFGVNLFLSSIISGVYIRNNVGFTAQYNSITSNNLAYSNHTTMTAGVSSSGTTPTVAYSNTISNNTIVVNNNGLYFSSGIDFGFGSTTGNVTASNNNITINQSMTAATSNSSIQGIRHTFSAGTINFIGNSITINQTTSTGANNAQQFGITAGYALANTSITSANVNNNNITIKQNTTGGTYGGSIYYISVSGTSAAVSATYSGAVNVNGNTLNTVGGTIRTIGEVRGINHDFSSIGTLTINGNTISIDRTNSTGATFGTIATTANTATANSAITNNQIVITGTTTGAGGMSGIFEQEGNVNSNKLISGNTININVPTSQGLCRGIVFSSGPASASTGSATISNNNITLVTVGGTSTGIDVPGSVGAPSTSITGNQFNISNSYTLGANVNGINIASGYRYSIYNNNFISLAATGSVFTLAPTINMISLNAGGLSANPNLIYNNTIQNAFTSTSTNSATVNGITLGAAVSYTDIYKNKIFGLTTNCIGAATLVSGIRINSGANTTINVYNNLLGFDNSTASKASSNDAIRGINIIGTLASTNYNVYNNTIQINASSTGTNFGCTGIYHTYSATATSAQLSMRNNIVVNTSTAKGTGFVVAFRRSLSTSLANYGAASNNNLLYAGTPGSRNLIFYDGTNSDQSLTSFQTRVGPTRDNLSVTENPPFLSTIGTDANFLKLSTLVGTLAESGGAPIVLVTDDFEGDIRNATKPDIGADEFAGVCPAPTALVTGFTMGAYNVTFYPGSFTAASPAPTGGYLVVRTNTNVQPVPANGTTYTVGANAIGYIEMVGTTTSFNSTVPIGNYYYWVFSYNTGCSITPVYSATAATYATVACVAPAAQPTALVLTALSTTSISGSFTAAAAASGYLIVRTTTVAPPTFSPVNGTFYTTGTVIGGGTGTVVASTTGTTFTATGLAPATTYYFWVYAFNSGCVGQPAYLLTSPLNDNATTFPCLTPGTFSIGPTGNYSSIGQVISALQTCSPLNGNFIFELQPSYVSTVETFPLLLPALLKTGGAGFTITFRPQAGATNLSITSANSQGTLLIQGSNTLNFNDYYIIDGRPGGVGASKELTISNTFVGTAYAILLENDASNNVIQYCNIRSQNSATSSGGGTIVFGNTTFPNGNDNNTISNNDIFDAPGGTPTVAIYSNGSTNTVAAQNNNNIISNNNIYNYFNPTFSSAGILLANGSSFWSITGNHFYQTVTPRTITTSGAIFSGIVSASINNDNNQISGNYIGGTGPNCSGAKLALDGNGILKAISLTSSATLGTSIQGNFIQNINYTSSNSSTSHALIHLIGGRFNVGTVTGNTLGSQSATGDIQITLTDNSAGVNFAGILANSTSSADAVVISNNLIGGITVGGTSTSATAQGIQIAGSTATFTITGNTVGSPIANSFSHGLNTTFTGIWGTTSNTGTHTLSGNTISNITTTNTSTSSYLNGMVLQGAGVYNTNGNVINNLVSACTNTLNYTSTGIANFATTGGQTISANTISDVNSSAPAADVAVIGIYYSGPATGTNVIGRNLIHSLSAVSSVNTTYITGIQLQSGVGILQNNMIRLGINSAGGNITTAYNIFGIIDNLGSTVNIDHNSVYIGGSNVATGSNSYALYSTNTSARDIRNNIFWNARSNSGGASSPNHYAISLSSLTGLSATNLNYNDYLATGAGKVLGFYTADISTLAAWRTATGFDANSKSSYPDFVNPTAATPDLHIAGINATVVEQGGINIAAVTDDFDGTLRSGLTPTDLGADAVSVTLPNKVDVGVVGVTAPASGFGCYNTNETVTVTIRNFSTSTIVFATSPVTVTMNVTGAATQTLTGIPAGSLAPGATMNVTLSTTLNMSAAGLYDMTSFTSLSGNNADEDITNDQFITSRTVEAISIGTASSNPPSYCGSFGAPVISLNNAGGGVIQWYQSTVGIAGPWTAVGTNSLSYSPGLLATTTYFYASVNCTLTATTLNSNVVTVNVSTPSVTGTTNASRCGPGTLNLTATGTGGTIKWYNALLGGGLVNTGASFTTPNLTQSQTYYVTVEAATGAPAKATFGTATNVNTTTGYPSPYTNWYGGTKHQMMIRATELQARGITAGNITSVEFTVASVGTSFSGKLFDFQINMGSTSNTVMTGSSFEPAPSIVYGGVGFNQSIPITGLPATVTHTFTTPYFWDGVSNLIIQTSYSNGNVGISSDNVQMYYTDAGFVATTLYRADNATSATVLGAATPSGFDAPTSRRPNMTIGYETICAATPRVAVTATINPQPTAITITPATSTICAPSVQTLVATGGTVTAPANATYNSGTIDLPILDLTNTNHTINVSGIPAGSTIDSVIVSFNTIHTYDGDLSWQLTAPNGQRINMINRRGGSSNNFTDTRITSDGAFASVAGGAAPFTGTYSAELTLSPSGPVTPTTNVFSNLFTVPNGNWQIDVYDAAFIDEGTLQNWSVKIAYSQPVVPTFEWSPSTGLYTDAGATTPYTGTGSPTTIYARPTGTQVYTATATAVGGCTSTQTASVTVNSATAANTAARANGVATAAVCEGSNVTLTQTGGTLGTGAQWQWYIGTPANNFLTAVGVPTTAADAGTVVVAPAGTTTYYVRSIGGTSPCAAAIPSTSTGNPVATVNATAIGTWLGLSSDWNTASNWCGGIPTATTNVTIPVTANNPVINAAVNAFANNITIAASAALTVNATGSLSLSGNTTNNGTLTNNGHIALVGTTGTQSFPGTGTVGAMNDLTLNHTGAGVTLTQALGISGAFTPTAGALNLGAFNITLRSTATTTARVGQVGATVSFNYAGGGQFIVERYFPARRSWRLLTSPLYNTGTIYNTWQNGGVYTPGVGTLITGPSPSGANGLDVSGLNNISMRTFNSATQNYVTVSSPFTTNLSNNTGLGGDNVGYFMFVRGDRDPANTTLPNTNVTTLSSPGRLQFGTQSFNATTTSGDFTLLGNPYPSPVDFNNLTRTNLLKRFVVWDPQLNIVGGFVTVDDIDNDGVYLKVPPSPGGQDKDIQSSQAFFVQTNNLGGAATLTFNETSKSVTNNLGIFRPMAPLSGLRINLLGISAGTPLLLDGTYAQFGDQFDSRVDLEDALKFTNINETIGLDRAGKSLAIERRKTISVSDTLYLKLIKTAIRKYRFELEAGSLNAGGRLAGFLEDRFLGIKKPINLNGQTSIDFEVTSNTASAAADRFRIVFGPAVKYTLVNANVVKSDVVVNWKINEELNVDHYEIERSADGNSFTKLGSVVSRGDSYIPVQYDFTDVQPTPGTWYYRIRTIAKHGAIATSDAVVIKMMNPSNGMYVFPNPVKGGSFGLQLNDIPLGIYKIRLLAPNGQMVFNSQIVHPGGAASYQLSPEKWTVSGHYQLEVTGPDQRIQMLQVVVVK